MAGRVVRGIGALGSANVFRGAIALFQRIQHPWKDKLLGTYPPSKGPVYCKHHACSSSSNRGNHHGGPPLVRSGPWSIARLPEKLPVKVLLNGGDPENDQKSSVGFSATRSKSMLQSFLLSDHHEETFNDHVNRQYGAPNLHYETGVYNNFQSFGKQELGQQPQMAQPKTFLFNPLLYRSHLSGRRMLKNSLCERCTQSKSAFNKVTFNPHDFVLNSNSLSSKLLQVKRKLFLEDRQDDLKNLIVRRLKKYKHLRESSRVKAYFDLLARALLGKAMNRLSKTPEYLSLMDKLAGYITEGEKSLALASPVARAVPLLTDQTSD